MNLHLQPIDVGYLKSLYFLLTTGISLVLAFIAVTWIKEKEEDQ